MQEAFTAIQNSTDPFAITDKERLYVASGAPVSPEVEIDIL